ncbi:hypothetical protein B4N89_35745 [Embleya scabrispora]|uniref:Uncharacterized protein n=2 Tax=Embleya scabrispora TaxID=159449 RepID=A0A1T3NRQ5_9ACTN|nr:hypothetical protein B4N89_35745 [Embleya scabrispora]
MGGTAAAAEGLGPQSKTLKAPATGTSVGSDDDQAARTADGVGRCPRPTHDCQSGKPDHKPAGKPDHKPAEKPADKPADKPDHKPSGKPDHNSDHKPAGKPDHKPIHRPVVINHVTNTTVSTSHVTVNHTTNNTVNINNNHTTNIVHNHKPAHSKPEHPKHERPKHDRPKHVHHKNDTTKPHHVVQPAAHHGTQTKTTPVGAVAGGSGGTTESDAGLLALGGALAVAGAGAGAFALRRGSLRG